MRPRRPLGAAGSAPHRSAPSRIRPAQPARAGRAGYRAPSDTLQIAGVGVGGMGRRYLQNCESERTIALCDVDHGFAAKVFRRYPNAKRYRDFREIFAKEKGIDAVVVATPDHDRARVQMAALRLRKHVPAGGRARGHGLATALRD